MDKELLQPTPKQIVELLTDGCESIKKNVVSRRNGTTKKDVVHLKINCPKGRSCRYEGKMEFVKSSGYSNPKKHLQACISGGSEKHLLETYKSALIKKRNSHGLHRHSRFRITDIKATDREQAYFAYLELITELGYPLSHLENKTLRRFSKFSDIFSIKYFKEVMFLVVKFVEEIIADEMKDTRGSILYDGWTNSGVHYLGIFACYMKDSKSIENGISINRPVLCMPLLSMSPMQNPQDEEDEEGVEKKEVQN